MSVLINASTSSGIGLTSDNSGVIQFQSNGANTVQIAANGTILNSSGINITAPTAPNVQTFNSSGTWTKPSDPTYSQYSIEIWGAGASGAKQTTGGGAAGGSGGGYWNFTGFLTDLGSTETVTIGLGGASQTTANSAGNPGGNSSITATGISKTFRVYGGQSTASQGNETVVWTGPGGGSVAGGGVIIPGTAGTGVLNAAAGPDAGNGGSTSVDYGRPGTTGGGGGGAGLTGTGANTNYGGNSVWGGAGGGGGSDGGTAGSGGTSIFGGNGGAGGADANNGTAGTAPGGGGGGTETGTSGAGANGRIIVTVF